MAMLTSEHSIVRFDRGRARPDRLERRWHRHYLDHAAKMLAVYKSGAGATRRELHRSVEGILAAEPDCPARRIAAFSKLLDDLGEFETDPRGRAAELRLKVFALAAPHHPLVREADRLFGRSEVEVKAEVARELGRPWAEVERDLYADVLAEQRLASFAGPEEPGELLSRYNVAQLQTCLYRAESMAILAEADFKTILRYAKLARLLHAIRRAGPGRYRIDLSGPASVLAETRRYGVLFARFLPALLACRGWKLRAELRTPWRGRATLCLSSADGYRSHLPAPAEFDSAVEEKFAAQFGAERDGWKLLREAAVVHEGQSVFVPDFVFRHADGTEVLFEIVGFWTPEYLAAKRETVRRFRRHKLLLAVHAGALREGRELPPEVIAYKTAVKVERVLEALGRLRPGGAGR